MCYVSTASSDLTTYLTPCAYIDVYTVLLLDGVYVCMYVSLLQALLHSLRNVAFAILSVHVGVYHLSS